MNTLTQLANFANSNIAVLGVDSVQVALGEWPAESFRVYVGKNTLTKKQDVFVAFKNLGSTMIVRWSGKKQRWEEHTTIGGSDSPLEYLRSYDKVSEPKMLKEPQVKKIGGGVVAVPVKKEGKGTMLNKIFGTFGKAPKGAFALSLDGKVAIRRGDATYAYLGEGNQLVNVDTMAIDVDAFYFVPTPVSGLAVNDVVDTKNGPAFVLASAADGVTVYYANSESVGTIKPSKHFLMPEPFVTKVLSLLSPGAIGGGAAGGNNGLLMLLALSGNGKMDTDTLLPLMLMGGAGGLGGGIGGMNPMMLMLLLNKDGKGGGLGGIDTKTLLLMTMMGGAGGAAGGIGGMNPLVLMMLLGKGGNMDDMLPLMLLGGNNPFAPAPAAK